MIVEAAPRRERLGSMPSRLAPWRRSCSRQDGREPILILIS